MCDNYKKTWIEEAEEERRDKAFLLMSCIHYPIMFYLSWRFPLFGIVYVAWFIFSLYLEIMWELAKWSAKRDQRKAREWEEWKEKYGHKSGL
jgi:hypothetical protein